MNNSAVSNKLVQHFYLHKIKQPLTTDKKAILQDVFLHNS